MYKTNVGIWSASGRRDIILGGLHGYSEVHA